MNPEIYNISKTGGHSPPVFMSFLSQFYKSCLSDTDF